MKYEIDKIDLDILKIYLQMRRFLSLICFKNSCFTQYGSCSSKKMEDAGIIKNFTINIDYSMLGFTFTGYLGVFLDNSNIYEQVMSELKLIPQITVIDFTTGPFSVFCKIRSRDSESAREVLERFNLLMESKEQKLFIYGRNSKRKNSLINSIEL